MAATTIALSGGRDARLELVEQELTIHSPGVLDPDARIERSRVRAVIVDRRTEAGPRFAIEPADDSDATVHPRPWESRYTDDQGALWLYPNHPPTAVPIVNPKTSLAPNLLILFDERMALPAAARADGFVGGIVQALRMLRDPRGPIRYRPVQGAFCVVPDAEAAAAAFAGWPLAERVPYDVIVPPPPLPDDPEILQALP